MCYTNYAVRCLSMFVTQLDKINQLIRNKYQFANCQLSIVYCILLGNMSQADSKQSLKYTREKTLTYHISVTLFKNKECNRILSNNAICLVKTGEICSLHRDLLYGSLTIHGLCYIHLYICISTNHYSI